MEDKEYSASILSRNNKVSFPVSIGLSFVNGFWSLIDEYTIFQRESVLRFLFSILLFSVDECIPELSL